MDLNGTRVELAKSYFHEARLQAIDGEHKALPFYRAAVRLNPFDIESRLELAHAEITVGSFRKAMRHLRKVLEIEGSHTAATEMLAQLHNMAKQDTSIVTEDSIDTFFERIKTCSGDFILQELDSSTILPCDLDNNCVQIAGFESLKYRPFIIRNALSRLSREITTDETLKIDYLKILLSAYGDEEADFYPHNLISTPSHGSGTGGFKSSVKDGVGFFDLPEVGIYKIILF
jgi:hypothetical protein